MKIIPLSISIGFSDIYILIIALLGLYSLWKQNSTKKKVKFLREYEQTLIPLMESLKGISDNIHQVYIVDFEDSNHFFSKLSNEIKKVEEEWKPLQIDYEKIRNRRWRTSRSKEALCQLEFQLVILIFKKDVLKSIRNTILLTDRRHKDDREWERELKLVINNNLEDRLSSKLNQIDNYRKELRKTINQADTIL